jgi:hypothetical protein
MHLRNALVIVTNGTKSMVGSKTGRLKQLGVKFVFLRCIIHKKALRNKIIKMNQTMKMVVNIVTYWGSVQMDSLFQLKNSTN